MSHVQGRRNDSIKKALLNILNMPLTDQDLQKYEAWRDSLSETLSRHGLGSAATIELRNEVVVTYRTKQALQFLSRVVHEVNALGITVKAVSMEDGDVDTYPIT